MFVRIRFDALLLVAVAGLPSYTSAVSAQVRDSARVPASGTGTISGVVVAADTGGPVARAQIVATGFGKTDFMRDTIADDAGRFVIEELPAGKFDIQASKPGLFLPGRYGQAHPGAGSRPVIVTAGERRAIEIRMFRPGVISGRVFDDAGDPLPFTSVSILRDRMGTLERPATRVSHATAWTFAMAGSVTTNDRGEYRLFGLMPGRYVVLAYTRGLRTEDQYRYEPTYFPGVTDAAAATRLTVGPGQELMNVDVAVRLVRGVDISGFVFSQDGSPLASGSVQVTSPSTDGPAGVLGVGSIREGEFVVRGVVPGQHVLRARFSTWGAGSGSVSSPPLSASLPITVGQDNISGIVLTLNEGASLNGRMVFEGANGLPRTGGLQVFVESGEIGRRLITSPAKDGRFLLRGIESGPREIRYSVPSGWTLKGIYVDGQDVTETPLQFQEGVTISGVSLVFTNRPTRVEITIAGIEADAPANVIIVFPEDPNLWRTGTRRISIRTAERDPISISALPPGDYLVAAVADPVMDLLNPYDARQLEQLRAGATSVRLEEGTTRSVMVRPQAILY